MFFGACITHTTMVKVYNPIYDTVFKYLMEDDKAAKVLLGSILELTKTIRDT